MVFPESHAERHPGWWCVLAMLLLAQASVLTRAAVAQDGATSGQSLYRSACANCHGVDGAGADPSALGFSEVLPDFTDCNFATREPDADWSAIVHQGGTARGFSRIMPAFGDALSEEEILRVIQYVRGFCASESWPRGDLNLPRPLVTEKAYPEDEAVMTVSGTLEGSTEMTSHIVYERRFGARNQFEIDVPLTVLDQSNGDWAGGIGDVAVAVKRALFHSLSSGSIFSVTGELVLPTGNSDKGLGGGTTVVEPFVTFGQLLPSNFFLHAQAGVELPLNRSEAENEVFARTALGKTLTEGRWGRSWSPMAEVLFARPLEAGAATEWTIVPEVQISLNRRQHLMVNLGVLVPLTETDSRSTTFLFYFLWDWFDGGLTAGW
jgi:mono/diheme cytochrome c family protein